MSQITRRQFVGRSIQGTALAAAAATLPSAARGIQSANAGDKVVLALLGAGGRGTQVALNLASLANVEFKYVCDLEAARAANAAKALENTQGKLPQTTPDMRTVFDDKDVHGVLVATPEQWHALATIWACQAGKDVYVEKCISRRVEEGRKMVQAARKYERVVQAGTQHRSTPYMIAARQYIQDGQLGEIFYVKVCNMLPETYGGYPLRRVTRYGSARRFRLGPVAGPGARAALQRPGPPQLARLLGFLRRELVRRDPSTGSGPHAAGRAAASALRRVCRRPLAVCGRWRDARHATGHVPVGQAGHELREHGLHARHDEATGEDHSGGQAAQLAAEFHADRGLRDQGHDVRRTPFPGLAGPGPRQQDRRREIRSRSRDASLPELGRLHPQPPATQRRHRGRPHGRLPGTLGQHRLSDGQSTVEIRSADREVHRQRRGQRISAGRGRKHYRIPEVL